SHVHHPLPYPSSFVAALAPKEPSRTLSPFAEQVYSAFRVKPDTEPVLLPLVYCRAFPASVATGHLDLVNRLPSRPPLHLVNHVLELDRADITAKKHALTLNLFPVIAPSSLADRTPLLSYFQTVYSSPNAPSNTDQNNRST